MAREAKKEEKNVATTKTHLPVSEADTTAVDLLVSKSKIDTAALIIMAETEQQKIRTEPVYFPNEQTQAGECIKAVLLGFVMQKDRKGEEYEGAVMQDKNKQTIICSSKKAVDKLKLANIGEVVELEFHGMKKSQSTGNEYHNIVVSYFE